MRRAGWMIAVLAALGFASAGVFAELSADKAKEAQALIKQFSAPEFAVRQQAVDKLVEMGPDVLPLVKKALADAVDNEVKLRCNMVIKGLVAKYGITPDGEAPKQQNFGPSLITMDEKDTPLADVLQTLAQKSGNAPIPPNDTNRGMRGMFSKPMNVTISVKDKPYWEVLDQICKPLDLCYDFGWDPKVHVRLRSAMNKNDEKGAYAGPVVIKVDSIQRSETLTSYVNFRTSQNDPKHAVDKQSYTNFQIRYFVEDRLPILASWMEFSKATTPDGVDHIPQWMRDQARQNRRGYSYNQYGPWTGQAQFNLQGNEAKFDQPLTLEGKVCLEMTIGRKELKFGGLKLDAAPAEKSAEGEGIEIRLDGIEKNGFNVKITCDINADAGLPVFTGGSDAPFGFTLVDSKGKVYKDVNAFDWKGQNNSSSGGGGPQGYRIDQYNNQPGKALDGKLTITFGGIRTVEGDWTLVFTYPERSEIKEFPFKIADIAMPKAPNAADVPAAGGAGDPNIEGAQMDQ